MLPGERVRDSGEGEIIMPSFVLKIDVDNPGVRYISDLSLILRDAAAQLDATNETAGNLKNRNGAIVCAYEVI